MVKSWSFEVPSRFLSVCFFGIAPILADEARSIKGRRFQKTPLPSIGMRTVSPLHSGTAVRALNSMER